MEAAWNQQFASPQNLSLAPTNLSNNMIPGVSGAEFLNRATYTSSDPSVATVTLNTANTQWVLTRLTGGSVNITMTFSGNSIYAPHTEVASLTIIDDVTDTDGDGVPDSADNFPNNNLRASGTDTDSDGTDDEFDTDDDGDGVPDDEDFAPLDPNVTSVGVTGFFSSDGYLAGDAMMIETANNRIYFMGRDTNGDKGPFYFHPFAPLSTIWNGEVKTPLWWDGPETFSHIDGYRSRGHSSATQTHDQTLKDAKQASFDFQDYRGGVWIDSNDKALVVGSYAPHGSSVTAPSLLPDDSASGFVNQNVTHVNSGGRGIFIAADGEIWDIKDINNNGNVVYTKTLLTPSTSMTASGEFYKEVHRNFGGTYYGVTNTGYVMAYGAQGSNQINSSQQNSNNVNVGVPVTNPTLLTLDTVNFQAGNDFWMSLNSSGKLVGRGGMNGTQNNQYQNSRYLHNIYSLGVIESSGVTDFSAGGRCAFYIKGGALYYAGRNYESQLGIPATAGSWTFEYSFLAHPDPNMTSGCEQVMTSGASTYVIKTDGSLWAVGWNGYGKLGLGDTTDRTSFTKVEIPHTA